MKAGTLILLLSSVMLAGCEEQTVFQGPAAQSAAECKAQYDEARSRTAHIHTDYSNRASVIGASIGRGLSKGVMESAYRQCLERVYASGAQPVPAQPSGRDYRAPIEAQMTPRRQYGSPHCPAHAGVLYGGVQYCR